MFPNLIEKPNLSRNNDMMVREGSQKNIKTVSIINSGMVNINIPRQIYDSERIKVSRTQQDMNNQQEHILIASLDHNILV